MTQRIVIIGGVAAGATAAAKLRRLDEHASITLLEKGPYVSFANCGLPYFISRIAFPSMVASPTRFVYSNDRNMSILVLRHLLTEDFNVF